MNRVLASCNNHKWLKDQEARLCRNNLQFLLEIASIEARKDLLKLIFKFF